MGGIVVKKALLHSTQSNLNHLKIIAPDTKEILFLGTPHLGSKLASSRHVFLRLLLLRGNAAFVKELNFQNKDLIRLEHSFSQLLERRRLEENQIFVHSY